MSVGIQCRLYFSRSLPVMTASTPGMASALAVSILTILACACGLRTMSSHSMPASCTSSTYVPLPRRKRGSSLRLIECPMPPTSGEVRGVDAMISSCLRGPRGLLARSRFRCGVLDGLDDVDVAGAPAKIPGDGAPDVAFAGIGIRLQQRVARHHHARGAVAALQAVLLVEAFLDRVELALFLETFDGLDVAPVGLHGEDGAGLDGDAVQENRARAAVRRV